MSVTPTPIFPQTIKNGVIQILPATTTTLVTVYAGGTNGTKIENIFVASSDTSSRILVFTLLVSGVSYPLFEITIGAGAGTGTGTGPVFIMNQAQLSGLCKDVNGNPYLYLASGTTLQVNCTTTVTTAKAISIFSQGGDY